MQNAKWNPELFEFLFSTYNEKARWALDLKGVTVVHRAQLPGFHFRTLRELSGQTATPVLRDGDDVIAGSANIIDLLERRIPDQPLYPTPDADRDEALEWQRWLDDDIGPRVRHALFFDILSDAQFSGRMFSLGVPGPKGGLYRFAFPVMASVLTRKFKMTSESASKARDVVARGVERMNDRLSDGRPYLVGDRFSVADLTAASLLFPICFPPELPLEVPLDRPSIAAWLARWPGTPTVHYVRRMYRDHRIMGPSNRSPDAEAGR